eukprot:1379394-Prymnesium_polylepis.1
MSEMGIDLLIPASCIGSYRQRLLFSSCWPVALLLIACTSLVGWELTQARQSMSRYSCRAAIRSGLQRTLPLAL